MDVNILNKILASRIQQYTKRVIYHNQAEFIPRMKRFFNIHESISVIHHINKLKNENHMIITVDAEKTSDKIQHSFIIRTLQRVLLS